MAWCPTGDVHRWTCGWACFLVGFRLNEPGDAIVGEGGGEDCHAVLWREFLRVTCLMSSGGRRVSPLEVPADVVSKHPSRRRRD